MNMKNREMDTAGYIIFHRIFTVSIQQVHLVSDEYLNEYGIAMSGNRQLDNDTMHSWVTCGKTIAVLAELHHEGIDFRLLNRGKDAPIIYNLIDQHITDMTKQLQNNQLINPTNKSTEECLNDLVKLDALAKAVHPTAVKHARNDSLGILGRMRSKFNPIGAITRQPPKEEETNANTHQDRVSPLLDRYKLGKNHWSIE